jgi:hypothetical protein
MTVVSQDRGKRPGNLEQGRRPQAHSRAKRRYQPALEALEDRSLLSTIFALANPTTSDDLLTFDTASPNRIFPANRITGLQPDDQVVAIAFRPSTASLYGVGILGNLYTIDTSTAVATLVGALGGGRTLVPQIFTAASFDPVADQLHVATAGQNLLVNPDTGAVVNILAPLAYDAINPPHPFAPLVNALAYTKQFAGATSATLYGIDLNGPHLFTVGGSGTSSNALLTWVADTMPWDAFTIGGLNDTAYGVTHSGATSTLSTVDLTTGTVTSQLLIGSVGTIAGLAVAPGAAPVIVPTFAISDAVVGESPAGPVNAVFTITLSAPSAQSTSVDYQTFDGTALNGRDYQKSSGSWSFAPGEVSKMVQVPILADAPSATPENFYVGLSHPVNAGLGRSQGVGVIRADLAPPIAAGVYTETFSNDVNVGLPGWMDSSGIFQHALSPGGQAQIQRSENLNDVEPGSFTPSAPDELSLTGVDSITFPLLANNTIDFARVNVLVKAPGAAVQVDGTNGVALFTLNAPQTTTSGGFSIGAIIPPPPGSPPPGPGNTYVAGRRVNQSGSATWTTVSVGREHLLPNGVELGPILGIHLISSSAIAFDDVTLLVGGANLPPHPPPPVFNPSVSVLPGRTTAVDVLAHEFDPDGDALVVASVGASGHGGSVTLDPQGHGLVDYTPAPGFHGVDTFTYVLEDQQGGKATVTVTVTVAAPPVAKNYTFPVPHHTTGSFTIFAPGLLANDFDPDGDPLTFAPAAQGTWGGGTINQNGSFTYTRDGGGLLLEDTFTYTLSDPFGQSTGQVHLVPDNQVPVAHGFELLFEHVSIGHAVLINPFTGSGSDPLVNNGNGEASANPFTPPSDADEDTLRVADIQRVTGGQAQIISPTAILYTPSATTIDGTITYTLADDYTRSNPATIHLHWDDVPPQAIDHSYDLLMTEPTLTVRSTGEGLLNGAFDVEHDHPLTAVLVRPPAHGVVQVNPDGTFTYTRSPSDPLFGFDTFTYKVNDGFSDSDVKQVSIYESPGKGIARSKSYTVAPSTRPLGGISDLLGMGISSLLLGGDSLLANDTFSSGASADLFATQLEISNVPEWGTLYVSGPGGERALNFGSSEPPFAGLRYVAPWDRPNGSFDGIIYRFRYPRGIGHNEPETDQFSNYASVEILITSNGTGSSTTGVANSPSNDEATLPNGLIVRSPGGIIGGQHTQLVNVQDLANPPADEQPPPSGVDFPVGFLSFDVTGVAPGEHTSVTLVLPPGVHPTSYWKFGHGHWYDFIWDGRTGAEILPADPQTDRTTIILHFVAGERGDEGGFGIISDPGGPALLLSDTGETPTNTTHVTGSPQVPAQGGGSGGSSAFVLVNPVDRSVAASIVFPTFALGGGASIVPGQRSEPRPAELTQGSFKPANILGDSINLLGGGGDPHPEQEFEPWWETLKLSRFDISGVAPEGERPGVGGTQESAEETAPESRAVLLSANIRREALPVAALDACFATLPASERFRCPPVDASAGIPCDDNAMSLSSIPASLSWAAVVVALQLARVVDPGRKYPELFPQGGG